MNYCPLNIYSGYTFLSSTLKIEDIFSICDKNNYSYFGICDLVNMHAYSDIEKYKNKFKSKPLYGSTIIYLLNNQFPVLLSLYIINEQGYKNLIHIISSYPNGINLNDLKNYSEGLVCILPTLSNKTIKDFLIEHDLDNLLLEINKIKSIFTHFYLGIEIYKKEDIYLINLLRENTKNINKVAFNKHLYLNKQDAIGLTILQAIKNDTKLTNKNEEGPYFFLSKNVILSLYYNEEIENSVKIQNLLKDFSFNKKRGKLLIYPLNENKKENIKNKCLKRLKELSLDNNLYISRMNYELDIIEKMGYLDYFLIVEDYVKYAKDNKIPVGPGRGSSAGSLISYLLNITEIDSIKYNLLFERFLNPERTSMPDIDIDFADYRRDEIINYINQKYGQNKTSLIITFQTMKAKQALRDIGRVFSYNNNDINTLSKAINKYDSFKDAYKYNEDFRLLMKDDYFLEIIKLAKKIEDLPRQSGIHAAGIIINDEDLEKVIPIHKNNNNLNITHFEAPLLEELGFLKMDILSLSNLTLIENMINYIHTYYDSSFDIKKISFNDKKTFDILNLGFTSNIFQLDSQGITKALKEVIINNFDDLVALLALYRPGPMDNIPIYANNKNKHLKINYIHHLLEPILKPTYGVIIYQEQIMEIVKTCASFSLGKADLFRRAISKKDSSILNELKDDFIKGCLNNKLSEDEANNIYNSIYKFANYGYNKSHTVCYSVITYYLSYIKANYPSCFYLACLNKISLNDPKIYEIQNELRYFNLKLHLPSISISKHEYVLKNNYLYIPFTNIKGINKQIINILQNNKISSFNDYIKLALNNNFSIDITNNLINAGCFDEFDTNRDYIKEKFKTYISFYKNISNVNIDNDELKEFLPIVNKHDEDLKTKYENEYNALNILLSGSLLANYKNNINKLKIKPLIEQINNFSYINIAVIVKEIRLIKTKKKQNMAILQVQDDTSSIEVVVFPRTYNEYQKLLIKDKALLIYGRFKNESELSFISEKITILEEDK